MISALWDIPGIQSQQSLDFLVHLLDPVCIYDNEGKSVYASPKFLELFQAETHQIGFFDCFSWETVLLSSLREFWERALQGEVIQFLAKVNQTQEAIECSLQFNAAIDLMFLTAKPSNQAIYLHQLMEEYERLILALFNHPSLAIALINPQGILIKGNSHLHNLLETVEGEAIAFESFIHVEDKGLDLELKQNLLNGEIESYTIEQRFVTTNQEIIWVNASVSLLNLPICLNGCQQYFVVLLEDITENKKIYDALIRTEVKWKTFVLNNLNLFIQTSNAGQIIYASPAVERILGYKAEQLLDVHVLKLIHPDDMNKFYLASRLWSSSIKSAQLGIECRWRTQWGDWVYLYIQGQQFPMALEIDGLAISGYDISDRKRLEAKLKASEEKFRSLVSI
jgi:PAS domain S-box-containing protein